jgi:hypothetical protein
LNPATLKSYVLQLAGTQVRGRKMPKRQVAETLGITTRTVNRILKEEADKPQDSDLELELKVIWDDSPEERESVLLSYLRLGGLEGTSLPQLFRVFGCATELDRLLKKMEAEVLVSWSRVTKKWRCTDV